MHLIWQQLMNYSIRGHLLIGEYQIKYINPGRAEGGGGKTQNFKQTKRALPRVAVLGGSGGTCKTRPIRAVASEEARPRLHRVVPEGSRTRGSAPLIEAGFVQHTIMVLGKKKRRAQ